jgi:hypothetical protein
MVGRRLGRPHQLREFGQLRRPNNNTQSGTALRRVRLDTPQRLRVSMAGLVETQNVGRDRAEVRVNGQLVASGASYQVGGGCAMAPAFAAGSIDLPPGEHLIELFASTVDPLFHVGAFWQFNFTWEPL